MPIRIAPSHAFRARRLAGHAALLAGASVAALLAAATPARAGNILVPGGAASTVTAATAAAMAASQQAAAMAAQAQSSLARATLAIQAMQAAQSAARNLALAGANHLAGTLDVPSGLSSAGAGGLVPDSGLAATGIANPVTSWVGANTPTQSSSNSGTTVDIQQTTAQAILSWRTFNVSKGTTVQFDQQGNASWVALNSIQDPSGVPSQILGQIKADGQVYLINRNGVIFGGSAQVNTHALIASSADFADSQFLANGIYSTQSGGSYIPSFSDAGGAVTVEAGAQITTTAPSSVTQGGGFVLLMGSQVRNAGAIRTPEGQTELAAGDDFILRPGFGTDANQHSTTRGNEIAPVLQAGSASGAVTNDGLIYAQQGDITLAGHAVTQDGVLLSTTSVNTRGTIHLLNSASDTTGSVTLTGNSLTLIAPELDSTDTALDAQRDALIAASGINTLANGQFDDLSTLTDRLDQSRIDIVTGGTVEFQDNSQTAANGGQVAVSAGKRVQVDTGATIDVSGSWGVMLPMSANDIEISKLQPNDMRDDPNNRDTGVLSNSDVFVDARDLVLVPAGTGGYTTDRYYTQGGVLEVSGYLGNAPHTIGEWTAIGGTITLAANEVVVQSGSVINISGGSVQYQSGYVRQSYLMGSDGRIYNINTAPADLTYLGIYNGFVVNHQRWGVTETYRSPLVAPTQIFEAGYLVGRDGGQLILSAPTSIFDGEIEDEIVNGARQIDARPSTVSDSYKLTQNTAAQEGGLIVGAFDVNQKIYVPVTTDIIIGDFAGAAASPGLGDALPDDRTGTTYLDTREVDGLGSVNLIAGSETLVDAPGSITIAAPITLAFGGRLTLGAPHIDIAASITARGGSVTAGNFVGVDALLDAENAAGLTLHAGATIDTRGLWTNARLDPADLSGVPYVDGGSVSLNAPEVTLEAGSAIDASSGGAILVNGKTVGGTGGDISLVANLDSGHVTNAAGELTLDGTVRSIGVTKGGALTLQSNTIVIGDATGIDGGVLAAGTAAPANLVLANDVVLPHATTLTAGTSIAKGMILPVDAPVRAYTALQPALFASGFSTYTVSAADGVTVTDGTQLDVTMPVYQLTAASYRAPTGADPAAALSLWTPPLYLADPNKATVAQRGGASLSLRAGGVPGSGDVAGSPTAPMSLGANAVIDVDPGQSITLDAYGQADIEGSLTAPSGTISIQNTIANDGTNGAAVGGDTSHDPGDLSIWIGANSRLDVSAQPVSFLDLEGRPYGTVADGGKILIGGTGANGSPIPSSDNYVVIRPGAVLDASGAAVDIDVNAGIPLRPASPMKVPSNGGTIVLSSYTGIYNDGSLRAAAGGPGAAGGTLTIDLEAPRAQFAFGPRILTISQTADPEALPAGLMPGEADPALVAGHARVGVDQITAGGFDTVNLRGADLIQFKGDVALAVAGSITLNEGYISLDPTTADAAVTLAAPYIALNGRQARPSVQNQNDEIYSRHAVSALTGNGTFTATADLIDVSGTVSFGAQESQDGLNGLTGSGPIDGPGFRQVTLSSSGDIRLLPTGGVPSSGNTTIPPTILETAEDLTLVAAQIYPATGVSAEIIAGGPTAFTSGINPDAVLTIARATATDPAPPFSVFGQLLILAPTIEQGGVLRAPLGAIQLGANGEGAAKANLFGAEDTQTVDLLPGSLTSTSAAGLIMPYGGTSDGINYLYDGSAVTYPDPSNFASSGNFADISRGVLFGGQSVDIAAGAVVDVSGGGELSGAGFVSGRGGSVDILKTPFASAGPAFAQSAASDKVYAIVPSFAADYAAVNPEHGAGDPALGQQVTLPAGVPGLPAGTYTLLPSNYALLPGAFRVEIGATNTQVVGGRLSDGSYLAAGYLGTANTGTKAALPRELILSPGEVSRTHAEYNETSYSDFALSQASQFGTIPPYLPRDAGELWFTYSNQLAANPLTVAGSILTAPADGGRGAIVAVTDPSAPIEIIGDDDVPTSGWLSLRASDLSSLNAATLEVGGINLGNLTLSSILTFENVSCPVAIRTGADLLAAQIILLGTDITVQSGATLDTAGRGAAGLDSASGLYFTNSGAAMLALSNGQMNFLAPSGTDTVEIQDGATLRAGDTIAIAAPGGLQLGRSTISAEDLNVVMTAFNLGTDDALQAAGAAGTLPVGWNLDQGTLDRLLQGDAATGAPPLQTLTLTAGNSINVFGSVDFDTVDASTGESTATLVLKTPAIYGFGSANDVATINTGTLVWNGIADNPNTSTVASHAPGAVNPATLGTGTLDLEADRIIFGYDAGSQVDPTTALDRLTLGFAAVNVTGRISISANNKASLNVYATGPDPSAGFDPAIYSGTGGNLDLITPLLTADAGAVMTYTAGGALRLAAPDGAAGADTSKVTAIGGEVDLTGATVSLDSGVALPSGRLVVNADGDVALGAGAHIDLSGRALSFFDLTRYSWGGDVEIASGSGNISQDAASVIDVSAVNNNAGSVTLTATGMAAGQVSLTGRILGAASDGFTSGGFAVRAQSVGDFNALNGMLNAGGVYDLRSFDIKQGDLTIGDGVKAHEVDVSIDSGTLTVAGTIDASGTTPGTIRLSASGDLTLNGVLDAHGTALQVDSYGQPIEAENKGTIELTTASGTLTLMPQSVLDVSVTNPTTGALLVANGEIELNVPRSGTPAGASATGMDAPANATANDIAIAAGGPLTIKGAASIAVNGFATYTNASADPNDGNGQLVTQDFLNRIDQDSQAFINGAYGGDVAAGVLTPTLQGELAGLTAYGDAFHLRPGVEIASKTPDGDLSTSGDLDFSGFRYGPHADRDPASPTYGAGEPGYFVASAGGNLNIDGSISDGFLPAVNAPVGPAIPSFITIVGDNAAIQTEYTFDGLPAPIDALGETLRSGYLYFPGYFTHDTNQMATVEQGQIDFNGFFGHRTYFAGQYLSYLGPNAVFAAGTVLTYPGVAPGEPIFEVAGPVTHSDIPLAAISPMLAPGSLSWSLRLVGGADRAAADSATLLSRSALGRSVGNVTLADPLSSQASTPIFSVVRTGTGNLDILAGGNVSENTPYGIYTAGVQSGAISSDYQQSRAKESDSTILGADNADLETAINDEQAYYPEHGGDLLLVAQGDFKGVVRDLAQSPTAIAQDDQIGNWLWRQGGPGMPTAWWINFGTIAYPLGPDGTLLKVGSLQATTPQLIGFNGIGTLGGGNVTLDVGGNAGLTDVFDESANGGLTIAVAGSGRVSADGSLTQTGGGYLNVKIGGILDPSSSSDGEVLDLRGDINVTAASVGEGGYSYGGSNINTYDPRQQDPLTPTSIGGSGFMVALGDGVADIQSRGALLLSGAVDPGRVPAQGPVSGPGGSAQFAWFSLWTNQTAIHLFSGGNLEPFSGTNRDVVVGVAATNQNANNPYYFPSTLTAVSDGSIHLAPGTAELSPSATGQLELLAANSIIGEDKSNDFSVTEGLSATIIQSGADPTILATPFHPGYVDLSPNGSAFPVASNYWEGAIPSLYDNPNGSNVLLFNDQLFQFGPDTAVPDLHKADPVPNFIYAATGDIINLRLGRISQVNSLDDLSLITEYRGAKAADIRAGRDIFGLGQALATPLSSPRSNDKGVFILNENPTDISIISAGRDIFYANAQVGGPGELDITAGRNLYQGDIGMFESVGPLGATASANPDGGAAITVLAGVGAAGPDYAAFAALYLNPANLADPARPLADQPGKVVETYDEQLYDWLRSRFGYSGAKDDALAYFNALPSDQQGVFIRQIYFDELKESGREFNDPNSRRFQSYLRGRDAIGVLFPDQDANGQPITYDGDLTLFSGLDNVDATGDRNGVIKKFGSFQQPPHDAGIHTDFGGSIEILTPGGATILGAEAFVPGVNTGLLTQGSGDIDVYALDSIALGLSRVFTTFGGNIVMWSATGDINAGRGAKTSVVFTPPRVTYDDYGNLALAPTVPSTGAGIATLNPIPEVPPGDIDLIAPLGTVDAGEAGIRVSGNLNIAALHVLNAANIQVQGTASGIPAAATPNLGALTTASNTAGQAAAAANEAASRTRNRPVPQDLPSIITVEVIGYGGGDGSGEPVGGNPHKPPRRQSYDPNGMFQVIGNGALSDEQKKNLTAAERNRL